MSKRVPRLKSDEAAERLLQQDLTDYLDPKHMKPLRFEFQPKNTSVNLRMSEELLQAVRDQAKRQGMPYQRFIRMTLEQAVTQNE